MTKGTITTLPPARYHLRSRANSTPAQPVSVNSTFLTPSIAQTEASASEVGHTPSSPLTSLSRQSDISEAIRPALYSQVASSIPSVEPSAPEVSVTSSTHGISQIFSALSLRDKDQGLAALVDNLDDEGEPSQNVYITAGTGPWTEVKYGKRARSPSYQVSDDSSPQDFECTGEQLDELAHSLGRGAKPLEKGRPLSRGEGTSLRKGKTVDPRNWGAANIPSNELNPELQRKALEFYAKYHSKGAASPLPELSDDDHNKDSNSEVLVHWNSSPNDSLSAAENRSSTGEAVKAPTFLSREEQLLLEIHQLKLELGRAKTEDRPLPVTDTVAKVRSISTAQVAAPLSGALSRQALYPTQVSVNPEVATAVTVQEPDLNGEKLRPVNQVEPSSCLGRIFGKIAKLSPAVPPTGGPPSSSDDSSSSDEEGPSSLPATAKRAKGRKTKKGHRLPTLKPREPDAYHGRADVHEFHKFMDECSNYVQGYSLADERYVATISSFLKGKAYKYYTMMVSKDASDWSLERFFRGLFDFCFPVDFRTSMREQLQHSAQGARQSVQEFVCELEELFMMVGVVTPRDRVLSLWNGLQGELRDEMFRFGLSPEVSTWEEVVAAAVRFELAEASRRRRT